MNTSNRYFNESIAIIQEKVQIMYQTFSLTNQTHNDTAFHDGQLVYIFSYEPYEPTKQNRLSLQTIEESENQIVSSTLAPIDSQDILSIYWVKEGNNGYSQPPFLLGKNKTSISKPSNPFCPNSKPQLGI